MSAATPFAGYHRGQQAHLLVQGILQVGVAGSRRLLRGQHLDLGGRLLESGWGLWRPGGGGVVWWRVAGPQSIGSMCLRHHQRGGQQ